MAFYVTEVVEVDSAEKASEYTSQGWVVLATLACAEPDNYHFKYSLGKLEETP